MEDKLVGSSSAGSIESVKKEKVVSWKEKLLLFFFSMTPVTAFALPWDGLADTVLATLTGPIVTTIAVIAVIGTGIAAFFAKLSWAMAGRVIGGIILIFGAVNIVAFFSAAAVA